MILEVPFVYFSLKASGSFRSMIPKNLNHILREAPYRNFFYQAKILLKTIAI
jgi:hypothetical protein